MVLIWWVFTWYNKVKLKKGYIYIYMFVYIYVCVCLCVCVVVVVGVCICIYVDWQSWLDTIPTLYLCFWSMVFLSCLKFFLSLKSIHFKMYPFQTYYVYVIDKNMSLMFFEFLYLIILWQTYDKYTMQKAKLHCSFNPLRACGYDNNYYTVI